MAGSTIRIRRTSGKLRVRELCGWCTTTKYSRVRWSVTSTLTVLLCFMFVTKNHQIKVRSSVYLGRVQECCNLSSHVDAPLVWLIFFFFLLNDSFLHVCSYLALLSRSYLAVQHWPVENSELSRQDRHIFFFIQMNPAAPLGVLLWGHNLLKNKSADGKHTVASGNSFHFLMNLYKRMNIVGYGRARRSTWRSILPYFIGMIIVFRHIV